MRRKSRLLLGICFAMLFVPMGLLAQGLTTGDISGVVHDPSGGAIPNARVTLLDNAKGTTYHTTTNGAGLYGFRLLNPSSYTLTASATGFETLKRQVSVSVGQSVKLNIGLSVGSVSQTITVTGQTPLLQAANGNISTTISQQQVQNVPNGGNDLSYVAQVSPGAQMNTEGGYGNFEMYGLPATSNYFTVNGMANNDPFLNLNNSGATNLLLGANAIQEATVVTNGYSGQYGQLAGAQVNYVTMSGTNHYHGNAIWYWTGRHLNANDYFNNLSGTPRPFSNVNQWAARLGGPFLRNKAWWFVDTEGLRAVLPTSQLTIIPSPQFEQSTLANLTNLGLGNSVPFYQKMFNLYNNAPGAANAKPGNGTDPYGCSNLAGVLPGFAGDGGNAPCALNFRSTAGNFTHEWQITSRVDFALTQSDHVFVNFEHDTGTQATYTDPINPIFNAESIQPEYLGQINWSHTFGPNSVNQLIISAAHYSAIFEPNNLSATLNAFPTTIGWSFGDGSFTNLGGLDYVWPQGRNVTQYGIDDNYSYNWGRQTLKFGENFRRYDIADHDYGFFTSGLLIPFSLADFYNGGSTGDVLLQSFPQSLNQPIADYILGGYGEDDIQVRSGLTVTIALRFDHYSDPVCQFSCFARLANPSLNNVNPNQPYNQAILVGRKELFSKLDAIDWGPRFGFAWQPGFLGQNTVIRGGIGLFHDGPPAAVADNLSQNAPLDPTFQPLFDNLAPTETNNVFTDAANAQATFQQCFSSGGGLACASQNPTFTPPSIYSDAKRTHVPEYQEWNLEIQHQFGTNTVVSVDYVGNHGIYEFMTNPSANAFAAQPGTPGIPQGFGVGVLPNSAPDPLFSQITVLNNTAISNYNGVTVSVKHRMTGFLGSGIVAANYTYGHALDMVSNGGGALYGGCFNLNTAGGCVATQNPFNFRQNYGNADYDVRHSLNANYVWNLPIRRMLFGHGWSTLTDGWTISGDIFIRTGFPYSVVDGAFSSALNGNNYYGTILPAFLGGGIPSCDSSSALGGPSQCLQASQFTGQGTETTFGPRGLRNQFRGPIYANTDMSIGKSTPLHLPGFFENAQFLLAFQFYNLFNHPNFEIPQNDVSAANFGKTQSAVSPPTCVLGSFLGGDCSSRLIQVKAEISF